MLLYSQIFIDCHKVCIKSYSLFLYERIVSVNLSFIEFKVISYLILVPNLADANYNHTTMYHTEIFYKQKNLE